MFARHPLRWLAPYAEGALSVARAREIAGHIFKCRRCRRALDDVRAGQRGLVALAPAAMPVLSWAELAVQLDVPARPALWSLPAFRWVAAALLVLVGGLATARGRAGASLATVALDLHRAPPAWQLPTSDADAADRWIRESGFAFAPPASNDRRQLAGATRLDGGRFALAYRLDGRPITLVVGAASGGSGGKRITRRSDGALEVSTWTHDGRAYALVAAAGTNACTLCHADAGPAAVL